MLHSYVLDVYWFSMGDKGYANYEFMKIGFPRKPADILGQLRIPNSENCGYRWFYYKDNQPNHYGWGGQTHAEWCYIAGDDLTDLLSQMRREDVIAFGNSMRDA